MSAEDRSAALDVLAEQPEKTEQTEQPDQPEQEQADAATVAPQLDPLRANAQQPDEQSAKQTPPKVAVVPPSTQMSTSITSLASSTTTSTSQSNKLVTGTHFINAVNHLLDAIADKDELVRRACESALARTVDKRPNEALMAICDFRAAKPKMPEAQIALLWRVIEQFCGQQAGRLHIDPLQRLIACTIAEITRSAEHVDAIQRPGCETLVAIGRLHCDRVMDALCAQLQQGAAAHFMVLRCMGALAVANQAGIVQHLKPTLVAILPTLSTIRADHVRQAYAQAIGRFAEAITECSADAADEEQKQQQQDLAGRQQQSSPPPSPPLFFDTEMAIAYDVFIHQWLPCRDAKISGDILQALAHMYALLPTASIDEQSGKVIALLLSFYRRSMDRNAITQLLAAVLKATLDLNPAALHAQFDPLCVHLFDLVCVAPDYERPQTVKGHYEVLRCFDRLFAADAGRVSDMLLVQMRSNNERERIKSLLVLTHLCNQYEPFVRARLAEFAALVRPMLLAERTHKMRMVLLKLVLALAQNGLLDEPEGVRFLLRNCAASGQFAQLREGLPPAAVADAVELQQTCRNSLYILVTSVPQMDGLMKAEMLRALQRVELTPATETVARCLGKLFARDTAMPVAAAVPAEVPADGAEAVGPTTAASVATNADEINPLSPETIFVRCLCLLGNPGEPRRSEYLLQFLRHFCPVLNRHLRQLWMQRLPELQRDLDERPAEFAAQLLAFVQATIRDVDDYKFAEFLVLKLQQQQQLYSQQGGVPQAATSPAASGEPTAAAELSYLNVQAERGMLLKLIGICVGYVSDAPMIAAMIELCLATARAERFEKAAGPAEWVSRFGDSCAALGHISRTHLTEVLHALATALQSVEGGRKSAAGSFFGGLGFLKDAGKEADVARVQLLVSESLRMVAQMAPPAELLPLAERALVPFVGKQLAEAKDAVVLRSALQTLQLLVAAVQAQPVAGDAVAVRLTAAAELLEQLVRLDVGGNGLALLPLVLQVATGLLQLQMRNEEAAGAAVVAGTEGGTLGAGVSVTMFGVFEAFCRRFFGAAQQLRGKFETVDEDVRNSFIAKHLNDSLPELNALVRVVLERAASPAALDEVNGVLEPWLRNANSEVRICAGHVLNHSLAVFMRSVRIGGSEAPSKFGQCGAMLAACVPRCVDVKATVRQTAVAILQKILEIACVYESLVVADETMDWMQELQRMREDIVTDDSRDFYRITGDMARIIAQRLSHFQYLQFCKSLLYTLNDVEQSSAIGSSLVLRSFVQIKGGDLFHAIPALVKESLHALGSCQCSRARSGVLKALVALAKHHPIAVCNEMLGQPVPFDQNVRDFWKTLATVDPQLAGTVLDNFLATLSASCLYDTSSEPPNPRRPAATAQPFAIHCTLLTLHSCPEIRDELQSRFPDLFAMLLTSLATYTNLAPPLPQPPATSRQQESGAAASTTQTVQTSRSKFGFGSGSGGNQQPGLSAEQLAAAAAAARLVPCQIVLDSFRALLANLGWEQLDAVLAICPQLADASDLQRFIELLAPMAVGLVRQLGDDSRQLSQTVQALARSVSSPYDPQRIAAVGLYAQLVPLRPTADGGGGGGGGGGGSDVTAIIMLHLNSGLTDPNALVRGLCIRGLAQVAALGEHEVNKYAEISLAALLKGVDDFNATCAINVPLESMLGLSRLLNALPRDKLANFQVSLAIRLRPFFENTSAEIREAAILLFGDLCRAKLEETVETMMRGHHQRTGYAERRDSLGSAGGEVGEHIAEALREQLLANFVTILLHLSEPDAQIVRACKVTLRRVCTLLNAPRVNAMVQAHLPDHGQLHYDVFVVDLLRLVGAELNDSIPDFIESALPFLRSAWPQLRGNAAVVIGILHNLYLPGGHATETVSQRLSSLLRDDQASVRVKAAQGIGHMFGDL